MRDVPQRAEHEEDGNVGRGIVDGDGGRGHGDAALRACGNVDVIVACAVMAYVFERCRQRVEQLRVEVPRVLVRVVGAVEGIDSRECTRSALRKEFFSCAGGVLI